MSAHYDAIVIGSGPNGLAAAVALAREGASVLVVEAHPQIGGGMRSGEATLPGFIHDYCSACHPMGVMSPFFRTLGLEEHGLTWLYPEHSVAHPLDDGPPVMLSTDMAQTMASIGADGERYRRLLAPFVARPHDLFHDALAPLGIPKNPLLLARFGWHAWRSAKGLAGRFHEERAKALLAGCAAHSIQPLENLFTGAMTMMFLIAAHEVAWPVAKGGSHAIANALASVLRAHGGTIETGRPVEHLDDLPSATVVLFDTSPSELARIAADALPQRYLRRLSHYRYGPGAFKLDWALSEPIPWADPQVATASTVHLGGTFDEIAASERAMFTGEHSTNPYVLLVQQSTLDPSRAPSGQSAGYAYCHVPANSTVDMTEVMEAQVERFAPGFRDTILARNITSAPDFAAYNRNNIGGAVTGGVTDMWQLFTRPVARLDPYSTPNPALFICSASTPPGGGVHGMCGAHAAKSALRRLRR